MKQKTLLLIVATAIIAAFLLSSCTAARHQLQPFQEKNVYNVHTTIVSIDSITSGRYMGQYMVTVTGQGRLLQRPFLKIPDTMRVGQVLNLQTFDIVKRKP